MKIGCLYVTLLFSGILHAQTITTVAGIGVSGFSGDGGLATAARIGTTGYIAFDSSGSYYFGEYPNRVRKVSNTGIISTVAGVSSSGFSGDGGLATNAHLNFPSGIALDWHGNLYISDQSNSRIRKVDASSGIINTVVGTGTYGYSGDSGLATLANIGLPYDLAFDVYGNLYFADGSYAVIRKIDTNGIITTIAGVPDSAGFTGDGGQATNAKIAPEGIYIDVNNNMYIANVYTVRKIKLSTGIITTIAGHYETGFYGGYSGDGGSATDASFQLAWKAVCDRVGNLFISDMYNHVVRVVDTGGIIHAYAGNGIGSGGGVGTYSGDGGPATVAGLYDPRGIALDLCGSLYILVDRS